MGWKEKSLTGPDSILQLPITVAFPDMQYFEALSSSFKGFVDFIRLLFWTPLPLSSVVQMQDLRDVHVVVCTSKCRHVQGTSKTRNLRQPIVLANKTLIFLYKIYRFCFKLKCLET